MKIKVCGITRLDQLQALEQAGAAYAGLIFVAESPRMVPPTLSPESVKYFPGKINKTGVFVDATKDEVAEKIATYGLQAIQLHGQESPDFCNQFREQVTVIKVLHPNVAADTFAVLLDQYAPVCNYFLFDARARGKSGGTGTKFDWSLLDRKIPRPFFLSGGIGPEDAADIQNFAHPEWYATDINSRFETAPGIKDMDKIEKFITQIRN